MSIKSRPMLASEYSDYLAYFVPDYAAEIETNYDLSHEDALNQAKREVAVDLPQGVETDGEVLLCLEDEAGKVVGYLWYTPNAEARSVFIKDFYVFPDLRGQGYGKAALRALEQTLKESGFDQIKLRVAADNVRALRVYEATGYRVTGMNMSKNIDPEPS